MVGKRDGINFAFQRTMPVLPGYLFLGIAFGFMLQDSGFHFIWAFAVSLCVYAGSMQFVMVTLLSGGAGLLYTAVMTLFINGRHIFYGLSLVEKYKKMGASYPYMIFSLTDETYSVMCGTKVPENINEKEVLFYISVLNHCYWLLGSVAGGVAGQFLTFDSTGIEFSMTALFAAIVVEQWQSRRNRISLSAGIIVSIICLFAFGPDRFILPSLAITMLMLLIMKTHLEKQVPIEQEEKENDHG